MDQCGIFFIRSFAPLQQNIHPFTMSWTALVDIGTVKRCGRLWYKSENDLTVEFSDTYVRNAWVKIEWIFAFWQLRWSSAINVNSKHKWIFANVVNFSLKIKYLIDMVEKELSRNSITRPTMNRKTLEDEGRRKLDFWKNMWGLKLRDSCETKESRTSLQTTSQIIYRVVPWWEKLLIVAVEVVNHK